MLNLKTATVITLTFSMCALVSAASAQTNPHALDASQPILSQTAHLIPTTDTPPAKTLTVTAPQKFKRVVKPVPTSATATRSQDKNIYGRQIIAATYDESMPTRFIYKRQKDESRTLVYFSPEANKSR